MPADETVVDATPAPEPAAALTLKQPSIRQEWRTGEEAPVDTATTADAPDPAPESAAPKEEPAAKQEPAPEPKGDAGTEEAPPARDWETLTADLTKEEIAALVKSNPALKRHLDGELGSRMQQREEAIRKEAAEKAIAEYNQRIDTFNEAAAEYERIEGLRESNPEEFARDWEKNPDYHRWVAKLHEEHEELTAKKTAPLEGNAAAATLDEHFDIFNKLALPETQSILSQRAPWYKDMPLDVRRRIEGATFSRDNNWLESVVTDFVEGTKAYYEKVTKDAVAAALEAAKNEGLAESRPDTPLTPQSQTERKPLTAAQIIVEHAANGLRNITREQLEAAYAERSIAS